MVKPTPPVIRRIRELRYDELDSQQTRIYDAIADGPRGGVRGPLAVWLHRPGLAERAQNLGRYCRYDSSLPARLSELAILVMAVEWGASYEWVAHEPHARAAGLDVSALATLKAGGTPEFVNVDERLTLAFVRALLRDKQVGDELYRATVKVLGENGVVDLVGVAGYYTLISMTIKVFDIRPAD